MSQVTDSPKCEIIEIVGSWKTVRECARTTVGYEPDGITPTARWKRKILLAEHSPVRQLMIRAKWTNLPSWVSVHFVRHKFGVEHYVRTQRSDRTGVDRGNLPQNAPVTHEILINAAEIIFISRKRLCYQASSETRMAWMQFLDALSEYEKELVDVCVPDCVYRGGCFEMNSCMRYNLEFLERRESYVNLLRTNI